MAVGLHIAIEGDAKGLDSALGKAEGSVKGFGASIGGGALQVAALAGGVGIAVGAIAALTSAAAADRDEQNKLNTAIKAAGAETATSNDEVEKAIALGQEKAFTDSETRAALEPLIASTGSVTAATEQLGLAQDVARLAGVDLATAADAVAKANAGSDGALRKLIPGMEKGATVTETLSNAQKLAAGQADTFAKSSAGMGAKASDAFSEIGETIGSIFLPVLDAVLPALLPILKAFGQLVAAILPVLMPMIKILAGSLALMGTALATVVGWLVKLVTWLGKAIAEAGHFLDSINPFKGISLPSLPFLSSSAGTAAPPTAAARTGASAGSGGSSATITLNLDGEVFGRATIRAIRTYDRRNARLAGV